MAVTDKDPTEAILLVEQTIGTFKQIVVGQEGQMVPVPGYPDQPTLAERVKQNLKPSTDAAAGFATQAAASAKAADDAAKLASQISGLETVADAIGMAALPLPDVWAPLSDSLRLITGYGRDVLVGSDVVARMVNFSRNSTATYIGKDGLLKTAAANEPRFEKEGLLIEGQSTNLFPWSQQFIGKWDRVNGTANADPLFPNAIALNNSVNGFVNTSIGNIAVDGTYTITAIVTGYVDGVTELSAYFASQWQGSYKVIGKFGQYTIVSFTKLVTASSNTSNTGIGWAAGKAAGVVLCAMQVEALPFASSYIPTAGAAVTRAGDIVTIPWAMNINPTTVTVALNYDLLGVGQANQRIIEYAAPAAPRYLMQVTPAGVFESYCSTVLTINNPQIGPGSLAVAAVSPTRHALRLTGKNISTITPTGPAVATPNVTIGAAAGGATPMFGHVRNLRIWHRALTDDQLKAVA